MAMGLLHYLTDLFSNQYTDRRGYRRNRATNRLTHRLVAAKKLGRALMPGEIVQHLDHDLCNDRPSNLWVFPNRKACDHAHLLDALKIGLQSSYKGLIKGDRISAA